MDGNEEAFKAFERGVRARPVMDVEHERVALGNPADQAMQKHGAAIEEEVLRALEQDRTTQ